MPEIGVYCFHPRPCVVHGISHPIGFGEMCVVRLKEPLDMAFHAILLNLCLDPLRQSRTVLQHLPTDLGHIHLRLDLLDPM